MTRRWTALSLLVAVAIVAVAGYAIGAGKSSKDLVLCASKKSGDLSLASAKGKCAKGEKKITVAKEGPVGPGGPQGAPGPAASATLEPVNDVKPGVVNCAANPGAFCRTSDVATWTSVGKGGSEEPSAGGYFKDLGGVVHLTGLLGFEFGGGWVGPFPEVLFYLPPGFRPGHGVVSLTQLCGSGFQTVRVYPSGKVKIVDTELSCAVLDGISFHP